MKGLDNFLTKASFDYDNFTPVTSGSFSESVEGKDIPILIDEVQCANCESEIGWSSDGTFTEFWTNQTETQYLCDDCCEDNWK
jgi:hypothetical protein